MIFRNSLENPATPISAALFGPRTTNTSKVNVTEANSQTLSAVYRAREVKAEAIAGSPVRVFDENGLEKAYPFFQQPNPNMTWFELCDMITTHLMFHGNFYALKKTVAGRVTELSPLHPNKVEPKWTQASDGRLTERLFTLRLGGKEIALTDKDIFHIPAGSFDGLKGTSLFDVAAQSLGTAIASERFAGAFYGNGNMSSGILTTTTRLEQEEADRLKASWQQKVQGAENAHDVIVLDNGATFESMSIDPVQAQFLEAREYNIAEVSRWTGVPPRLLMQTGDVGGRLIEQDGMEFSTYGLRGTVRRIESRFTQFILPAGLRMDINLADFERADAKTRSGAALLARKASTKTINDIRRDDNLSIIDDERADDPFYPVGGEGAGPESGGGDMGGETADQGGDSTSDSGIDGTVTVKEQNMNETVVALQKIYLAVGTVITSEEARQMISTYGFPLPGDLPEEEPEPNPEAGLVPNPEAEAESDSDDPDIGVS